MNKPNTFVHDYADKTFFYLFGDLCKKDDLKDWQDKQAKCWRDFREFIKKQ